MKLMFAISQPIHRQVCLIQFAEHTPDSVRGSMRGVCHTCWIWESMPWNSFLYRTSETWKFHTGIRQHRYSTRGIRMKETIGGI